MKILITSAIDLEKSAPSRLHFFVKHLSAKHKLTVISIKDIWKEKQVQNNQGFLSSVLSKILIYHPFNWEMNPVWQEFFSFLVIGRLLKRINAKEFDLHFNYNSLMLGYLVACHLKKIGIKTVYDLADNLPAMAYHSPQMPNVLRPLAKRLSRFLVKKNIELACWVTLTCQTLQKEFKAPVEKSSIIPNGINLDLFKKINSKRARGKGEIRLGYTGVLREWVDFEPLFLAIKRLSYKYNFLLEIAGKEGDFQRISETAKKIGISEKVKFLGFLPYEQIPLFLSRVDVGVLPFKDNEITRGAFPLKLLEYLAAGLPIISTPLPEVRRILGEGALYAQTSKDWQRCLEAVFKNYGDYLALSQSKASLLSRYDWELFGKALETVLLRCAKMEKI